MKISLRTRLIISYTVLSLFLVLSLLILSNIFLEKQFNQYIEGKQDEKNLSIVKSVLAEFEAGKEPSSEYLLSIGQSALNDGIILMVNDNLGNELFCMSCYDNMRCENMLDSMESTMRKRYPNFEGKYTEKVYLLDKNDVSFGTVTLGYYGPFYYNEADFKFIEVLNNLLAGAALIFLVIAVFVGFFMANRISEPIKVVTGKTQKIEKGNYADRIEFTSKTMEIDSLIDSVNALAASLEEQQELKKRMAMDYAHEFRTPLAAIQSNLEGIIDGIFEPTNDRIESIRQEILRLSRMVSDIDKITDLQKNNLILHREKFDFFLLLKQNLITFEAKLSEKQIKLKVKGEPCCIYGDKDKISSVIINLISNAVKYTDTLGEIDASIKDEGERIVFTVSDTGVGIDEVDLPYIFEHLYRVDPSRARDTGGFGIGLSVTKAIVEAHGGQITVQSEPKKGSVFTIILPKK